MIGRAFGIGTGLFLAVTAAQEAARVPSFEIRSLLIVSQPPSLEVILQLDVRPRRDAWPLIEHHVFTLPDPARIVADLANSRSRVRKIPSWDKAVGLKDVRLATQEPCSPPRCTTRLVLELEDPILQWQYEARQEEGRWILRVTRVRLRPPKPSVAPPPASGGMSGKESASSQNSEYYLGPGDQLDIRIFELPDFNMTLRVAPDGTISVAPIGRVRVAGMTVRQVEEMLRKYLQEKYIQDPHVSVNIREFESQRYTVMGAVKTPGSFPLYRGKTVITALAEAGGLLEGAGIVAYLYRMDDAGNYQRYVIDLRRLINEGDISEDVPLAPGDVLLVPLGDVEVYVYGAVQRPGVVRGARPFTLLRAIAAAGGPSERASLGGVRIIRADGKVEKVDVGDILRGKQKDVELTTGDIVFVPESWF